MSYDNSLDLRGMLRPIPDTALLIHPDYYIWCGSMVADDAGRYHLYFSRWPREFGHNAWVTHSEIAHAVADHPLGPYQFADVALPKRGVQYWDGLCTHNPTVLRIGSQYVLYYTGMYGLTPPGPALTPGDFNFEFRNHQRVGVAVADSPNGPWTRFDQPVIDVWPDPAAPDSLCTTNPTATQRPDGTILLIYKAVGRQRPLPFGGPVVHCVATAAGPLGPFTKHPGTIFTAAGDAFPAEDPYVWYQADHAAYYTLCKDMHGAFTQAGCSLALFASPDGIAWAPAPHTLVSTLQLDFVSGMRPVGRLERPQLWFRHGRPAVLFAAVQEVDGHSYNVHIPLAGLS